LKRILIIAVVCLLLVPATAWSQTRRRTTSRRQSRPAANTQSTDADQTKMALAQRAGAERVAEQIKLLSRFLFVYGGILKGLETAREAERQNQTSASAQQQTENVRAGVKKSFSDWRAAMDKLEIDFRATPGLQRYYTKLAGVAAGAATAEEQANAGQFDQAGRSLLAVVNRLADVLLEMP
jgi:Flp pilus assembly protein TadB